MFGICHPWMTTQASFLASCTNCPRNSFTWSTSSTDANWWRDFDGSSPSNPIQNIKLRNHFHKSPNLLSLSSTNALYFIWCLFYFTSNCLFFFKSHCVEIVNSTLVLGITIHCETKVSQLRSNMHVRLYSVQIHFHYCQCSDTLFPGNRIVVKTNYVVQQW